MTEVQIAGGRRGEPCYRVRRSSRQLAVAVRDGPEDWGGWNSWQQYLRGGKS
ncbi:MAG: hypothetical protein ABIR59_04825 [Gemmatimonadales bacterium]